MKLICWLKTLWYSIPYSLFEDGYISGHDYVETEDGWLWCERCHDICK